MRSIRYSLLAAVFIAAPAPIFSQSQKVIPPKTVYWMSATTQSGFGMGGTPSTGDMMRMAMGGGQSTIKMLTLDLGSKLPASPSPANGEHTPPAATGTGALPLGAPKRGTGSTPPEDFERPKGKLLLYWGCGETAKPGQPIVIDFAKVAAGEFPAEMFGGSRVRISRPPSASTWPTYVCWPGCDTKNTKAVPPNASLLGAHKIADNFNAPMDFTLQQDWMQGVTVQQNELPSGAVKLDWNVVPGSTAHFAQMVSGKDEGGSPTIVFWASSETQTFFSGMSDFVSPGEASRLVSSKQLLPASQSSCTIPKEAVKAAGGAGVVLLTSHGPEQNIIHPPRPKDPKVDWVQEWSVKARFVSRSGAILGMEMPSGSGAGASGATASGKPRCPVDASTEVGKTAGGSVGGSLGRAMGGAFGGMLGKKKKPTDCEP